MPFSFVTVCCIIAPQSIYCRPLNDTVADRHAQNKYKPKAHRAKLHEISISTQCKPASSFKYYLKLMSSLISSSFFPRPILSVCLILPTFLCIFFPSLCLLHAWQCYCRCLNSSNYPKAIGLMLFVSYFPLSQHLLTGKTKEKVNKQFERMKIKSEKKKRIANREMKFIWNADRHHVNNVVIEILLGDLFLTALFFLQRYHVCALCLSLVSHAFHLKWKSRGSTAKHNIVQPKSA